MRRNCIVCGSLLLPEPIYICRNMPAKSQNLPAFENLDEDHPMDFELCQCAGCGLVQFNCVPVPYYLDSTRAGERSEILITLRQQQYKAFIETYHLEGKKIIEIGAGKGGFLRTLKDMAYNIKEFGIENNKDFVRIAREHERVNVVCRNPESSDWHVAGAPFDAFTSFAYPARLINPNTMLSGVSNNLVQDGYGLMMVPSLEHLLEKGGFYDITVDHIAYYDKNTLRFLLEKNGFNVLEIGDTALLYIYAIVQKRGPYKLKDTWSYVEGFTKQIEDFIKSELRNNRKIAAWCAGHFAFTILSSLKDSSTVRYIIDNADFKQGKFTPVSHIKIVSADYFYKEPVDTILILGPMYINEIVHEIKNKYSNRVKIIAIDKYNIREIT